MLVHIYMVVQVAIMSATFEHVWLSCTMKQPKHNLAVFLKIYTTLPPGVFLSAVGHPLSPPVQLTMM